MFVYCVHWQIGLLAQNFAKITFVGANVPITSQWYHFLTAGRSPVVTVLQKYLSLSVCLSTFLLSLDSNQAKGDMRATWEY